MARPADTYRAARKAAAKAAGHLWRNLPENRRGLRRGLKFAPDIGGQFPRKLRSRMPAARQQIASAVQAMA